MNREIERLLKLSRIPNFRLLEKEQILLDEWKRNQEPVKPKRTRKKTTNEVKPESKEQGEIELEKLES